MPKWLALLSYTVALVLLFAVSQSLWIVLIFPAWVFLVSSYILITHLRPPRRARLRRRRTRGTTVIRRRRRQSL